MKHIKFLNDLEKGKVIFYNNTLKKDDISFEIKDNIIEIILDNIVLDRYNLSDMKYMIFDYHHIIGQYTSIPKKRYGVGFKWGWTK